MQKLYTLLLLFLFSTNLDAQRFESSVYLDSYTKNEISLIIGISVNYGVDLYRIRYYTDDINGNESIASGLLCVPQSENQIFPVACFQHGTILGGRDDVPSNLQGGFTLPMVFSAYGYVVCAPDLLGLGDSPGIHPYIHADTEASASLDMLFAIREYDQQSDDFDLNDQLFISGYSQGGHSAMALHREIETNYKTEFTVTASAPMSGPYSISEKMIDFTLGDEEYGTVAYLAWAIISYLEMYPDLLKDLTLESFFKPQYLDGIYSFKNEDITLWELNTLLTNILINDGGLVRPKDMFLDGIEDAIKNDPTDPLFLAMVDNDTYDWAPEAPTRLYYCVGDDQVTYENAILADSIMNANGANDTQAIRRDDFSLLDHGGCVLPASFSGILFFRDFQNILTSTDDITNDPNVLINYNNEHLIVKLPGDTYSWNNHIHIADMTGKMIVSKDIDSGLTYHDIGSLPSGMYVVRLNNGNKLVKSERIVKF